MRQNSNNWKRRDLESLYLGFGFIIKTGRGPHDKVYHPDFPFLVTSLPRHRKLAKVYVTIAVDLVDKLNALLKEKK